MRIFCIGECLTEGVGASKDFSYPLYLQHLIGCEHEVINKGKTMVKAETISRYPDHFGLNEISEGDIVCVWMGTNDLYAEEKPDVAFDYFQSFCNVLIEENVVIVAITVLPRSNKTPKGMENSRLIFNNLVRKNYIHVADVGNDPIIGLEHGELNAEFYHSDDSTHLNDEGYREVAKIVYRTIVREKLI